MARGDKAQGKLSGDVVMLEKSDSANLLCEKNFGSRNKSRNVELSLVEALYLLQSEKIIIIDGRGKEINAEDSHQKQQGKITGSLQKAQHTLICAAKDTYLRPH